MTGDSLERTVLAWRRTVLSSTVVATLTARLAVHKGLTGPGVSLAGLSLLGLGAVTLIAHRRIPELTGDDARPPGRSVPWLATSLLGYAALAIVLVVLP